MQKIHANLSKQLRLLIGTTLLCLAPATVLAAQFFVYEEEDGTTWITDHKLRGKQYTYIKSFGRPAATVSCKGVTPKILDKRALSHMPHIQQYADSYKVDTRLVKAIIAVESCFDRKAVSRVGARGLMQLMPATAKEMGVKDSFIAKDNIRGGIRYFSMMLEKFNNDTKLALAAYNAGPNAVDKYKGIPPYKETQNYVKRVMMYYEKFLATAN